MHKGQTQPQRKPFRPIAILGLFYFLCATIILAGVPREAISVLFVLILVDFVFAIGVFSSRLRSRILFWSSNWLMVGAFGYATGFLFAYNDAFELDGSWVELFALPGFPGFAITDQRIHHLSDWCMGEVWTYRYQVAGWNAVFWTGISLIIGFAICIFRFLGSGSGNVSANDDPSLTLD